MNPSRLDPSHASQYRALMLEAYDLNPDAFTSSAKERATLPLSWWETRLSAEPQSSELVLGSFHDSQLVGVVGLSFESREKIRHKATLFGMYVAAMYRGKGLGARLVHAALAEAGARPGVRIVQLTVTHGNRFAFGLYEKCGFIQFGLEPLAVAIGETFVSKAHMWCRVGSA